MKSISVEQEAELIKQVIYYVYRSKPRGIEVYEIVRRHCSSLYELLSAPPSFFKIIGLGDEVRLMNYIVLLREYAIRSARLPYKTVLTLENRKDFAYMMLVALGHMDKEVVQGLLFNRRNQFISIVSMALGSSYIAVFDVKTIIERLEEHKAHGLLLVHNHPSGVCSPSLEDEETTRVIAQACKEGGYTLIDHYIVTRRAVYSICTHEYLL